MKQQTTQTTMSKSQPQTILGKKYLYLGEGNCNIVLSLIGTGLMLRLRKSQRSEIVSNKNQLFLECVYYEEIMKILIGETFIQTPKVVELNIEDIRHLNKHLQVVRPLSRQHKRLYCKYGTLTIDYTSSQIFAQEGLPTLCIELKCKQGWMPEDFYQYGKCMFCMKQYLKLKKKQTSTLSGYCPLDLFSGNALRMKKAITEMILNPQNNFKVFTAAKQVFGVNIKFSELDKCLKIFFGNMIPESVNNLDVFIDILIKVLLNVAPEDNSTNNSVIGFQGFHEYISAKSRLTSRLPCDPSSQELPDVSVLNRILLAQLLEKGNSMETTDLSSDYLYVEELIDSIRKYKSDNSVWLSKCTPLQKYMMACSAKDCSIMISLQPLNLKLEEPAKDFNIVNCNGIALISKIGIIDLDPKPVHKVFIHRKRNKDVVESFLLSQE